MADGRRRYGIHLEGPPAVEEAAAQGWNLNADSPLQIAGDVLDTATLALRRIWFSRGGLHRPAASVPSGHLSLILPVTGSVAMESTETGTTPVDRTALALLHAEAPQQIISEEAFAVIEVQLPIGRFNTAHVQTTALPPVLPSNAELAAGLVGLVNAVFNSRLSEGSAGYGPTRQALEYAALALVADAAEQADAIDPDLHRAMNILLDHYSDPAFGVAELAAKAAVSERQLYRLFQRAGTSPAEAIRSHRARVAREAIDRALRNTVRARAAIARATGFTSAKAMQQAIAALDPDHTNP
jgi:AraC-like DNA-binding protein